MKHGKKYVDGAKLIERSRLYDTQEALDLCVKTGTAKFDETVEVHVKLGVDGLMQNPKAGTVAPDIARAITEAKAGKIEYRLDKTNIIHCPIGKISFGTEKLTENFNTLLEAINKAKPAAAKGQYIRSCVVAATMGPGVKINPNKVG